MSISTIISRVKRLLDEVTRGRVSVRLPGRVRDRPPSGSGGSSSTSEAAGSGSESSASGARRKRWTRVELHFQNLVDETPEARRAYLDRLAEREPGLRSELQRLLEEHESAGPLDDLVDWIDEVASGPRLGSGSRVAQYRLGRRLGGGGMGIVYEAEDERLGRPVALKFLAPAISTDVKAKRRFLVEVRAASALDHPNVCTILEAGETSEGHIFLAMPLYEGETLRSRIDRGALDPVRALDIAAQIARGLAAAHHRGIIHRDVKPANVMVTEDGLAKILDFGVAKVADATLTRSGDVLGTMSYMSPEQARGEEVDHRTDLWSLGAVLFEMLTGRRAFPGAEHETVRRAILTGPLPSLDAVRPELAATFGSILDRAFARERTDRYASAGKLMADLEALRDSGSAPDSLVAGGAVIEPGERRICSVLVTRIVPYDRLVEELDPDELHSASRRIDATFAEAVTTEGGVVLAGSGSRHEAAFGVPVANEDDERRALRCALAIRDRLKEVGEEATRAFDIELRAATGLDSGRVAVRRSRDTVGYAVTGCTVRVARELARRATEGQVLISSACRRRVGARFEAQVAREVDVPGEDDTVTAHEVIEARPHGTGLQASAVGRPSDFRGRDKELSNLSRLARKAVSQGGRSVRILGEPGIGKSRLIHEFVSTLEGSRLRLFTGRCRPGSPGTSYAPIAQVLRQALGANGGGEVEFDPDEVVQGLRDLGEELAESVPLILRLLELGHPDHPFPEHLKGDQIRIAVADAVTAFVSLRAAQGPLVLVFEDWHWADEASTSVLRRLADLAPDLPLFIVVTLRPGYGIDLRELPDVTTIRLGPLDDESSVALLGTVLRADSVHEELARVISVRTGGNPFYIEEFGADLVEQDVIRVEDGLARLADGAEVRLPDSVQAVIRARLDRVDAPARRVLFAASVIGREFTGSLVERITDEPGGLESAIEVLESGGLIQPVRVLPDPVYRFKHALTREVTYESLLNHERRRLHRRVAEALREEARPGEAPADVLAHHFARARAWADAMPYGIVAARRSMELSENADALSLLEALTEEWAPNVESSEASDGLLKEALLMKERVLEAMGRRRAQQQAIDDLAQLLGGSSDERDRIRLELRQGGLFASTRRYEEAAEVLERALERSRAAGDVDLQRKALRNLALVWWHRNEGTEGVALGLLEEALELDVSSQDVPGELVDRMNICHVLLAMGEAERALKVAEEMARVAERTGVVSNVSPAHAMARCHRSLGNAEEALKLYQEAAEEFGRRGMVAHQAFPLASVASLHMALGRPGEALEAYDEAIREARRARYTEGLVKALHAKAGTLALLGRPREAVPLLEEAQPLCAELEDEVARQEVTVRLASLFHRVGRFQDAAGAWGAVRQLARRTDDRKAELAALQGVAAASREHFGEDDLARPLYEEAAELAIDLEDHEAAARVLNSLGVLAWNRGDWEAAHGHYVRALQASRAADRPEGTRLILASLGAVELKLGRPGAAEGYLRRGLGVGGEGDPSVRLRGYALGTLGDALLEQRDPDGAEEAYSESLEIRRELGDESGEGWMLLKLADVEERRGALDRVRELNGRAYRIASRLGDEDLMRAATARERY